MTISEAIIELRCEFPAAARQLELAVQFVGSDEVSIEIIIALAVMAGHANNAIVSHVAQIDGALTSMRGV